MTRQLYGFCGFIGSGKDAAATALIDYTGATKFSFAGILKDVTATLFSWDRAMLDGTTPESRSWRELPDAYWTNALGYEVTPRRILQVLGTEVFRNFNKDIWIKAAQRTLELSSSNTAIFTDARFGNEMDFIHEQQGMLVWIARPGCETTLPEALTHAVRTRAPLLDKDAATLQISGLHASETSFLTEGAHKLDAVILNNGSLEDLTACVQHFHDVVTFKTTPVLENPIPFRATTVYLERYFDGGFKWAWNDNKLATMQAGETMGGFILPNV